jgi:hypothetical protein
LKVRAGGHRLCSPPFQRLGRKGKIKFHYPVVFEGQKFIDSESAYKRYKTGDMAKDMAVMKEIIVAKLQQHPRLFDAITTNDGVTWLEQCRHIVVDNQRWEGLGRNSNFIVVLISAFEAIT